jgi:hypothetical protein
LGWVRHFAVDIVLSLAQVWQRGCIWVGYLYRSFRNGQAMC